LPIVRMYSTPAPIRSAFSCHSIFTNGPRSFGIAGVDCTYFRFIFLGNNSCFFLLLLPPVPVTEPFM